MFGFQRKRVSAVYRIFRVPCGIGFPCGCTRCVFGDLSDEKFHSGFYELIRLLRYRTDRNDRLPRGGGTVESDDLEFVGKMTVLSENVIQHDTGGCVVAAEDSFSLSGI